MDSATGGDDDEAVPTPRKALWRSASWSAPRSSPAAAGPAKPPRAGRSALPPLQLHLHPPPPCAGWPRPAADDPSTPLPAPGISLVCPHVFIGGEADARDPALLRRHGITHVLNCAGDPQDHQDLAYKTLWLRDSPAEDLASVLFDAFDFLESARAAGGRALVHCRRGASRSAAIVVAYLMWRHLIPFQAALRRVRDARAVADPNLGFAAQLLRFQRRILLSDAADSPATTPRAYRMAPHSPYDPLHLVPKSAPLLDSRGAFLVRAPPSAVFVWLGRDCEPAMADAAASAAHQLVKYERLSFPVLTVPENHETPDFWAALDNHHQPRRVEMYDLDFEIFRRALKGGVVPQLAVSETTRLPARESGWSRVRHKVRGGLKELSPMASSDEEDSTVDSFSSTPSSSSTPSTFSPASSSSSSLEWNKYSPPHINKGKGKEAAFVSSPAIRPLSIAERRGSMTHLALLSSSDEDINERRLSPRNIVMDWCLSPPFIPEVEHDQGVMDIE